MDYFPIGQHPVAQYNIVDAIVAAPLTWLWGALVAANGFTLVALASAGAGMHLLARTAGASHASSLLAGLALQTSSLVSHEIQDGRLSQAFLLPWLLGLAGMYTLARSTDSGRRVTILAILTGLAVGITHLSYWFYGLFLVLACVPLLAAEIRNIGRAQARGLLIAFAVAAATCLPAILSLARKFRTLPGVERAAEPWMSLLPQAGHSFSLAMSIRFAHWPLWPLWTAEAEGILGQPGPPDHHVPIVVLCLALGGTTWALNRHLRPRRGPSTESGSPSLHHQGLFSHSNTNGSILTWASVALVGWALSLGPYLKNANGVPTDLPLPYLALYKSSSWFQRLWWPNRMALIAWVGLAVAAALGLDLLVRKLAREDRHRAYIHVFVLALIFADSGLRGPSLPLSSVGVPAPSRLYAELDGALVTTPVLASHTQSRAHLWYQVHHEQPILHGLGNHLPAHRPDGYEHYVESNALLRALSHASAGTDASVTVTPSDIQTLLDDGFRWVVLDPSTFQTGRISAVEEVEKVLQQAWGDADHTDGAVRVWAIESIDEERTVMQPSSRRRGRKPGGRTRRARGGPHGPSGQSDHGRAHPPVPDEK
jgi:hypothetical protein